MRDPVQAMALIKPNDWVQDVAAFQKYRMLEVLPGTPTVPDAAQRAKLIGLSYEEARELQKSLVVGDLVKTIDGCADLITICIGIALLHGVDITAHMEEVAVSNMEKAPADGAGFGRMTASGKSTKEGWKEPRIAEILKEQGATL